MGNDKSIAVTLGGECFEVAFEDKSRASGRDGTSFYFTIKDLLKDRGERSVVLFLSGTQRVGIENYDARIGIITFNALRCAFDSGDFSFEMPVTPGRCHELVLTAANFQPRKKSSEQIP